MECTHFWGPHLHGFWIIPLLFTLLMIVFATVMARRARSWRCGMGRTWPGRFYRDQFGHRWSPRGWSETPSQILDRRYASGEITKEQYEQIRRDIELNPRHSEAEDEA